MRGGPSDAAGPLAGILRRFRAEPSRTWSLVVTLFGDAIVPRGGSVWLGTVLAFFRAIEIGEGAVRTAMSRLAADGWLERNRVGRNSFYRLGERGRATFEGATRHIYHPEPAPWTGVVSLVLLGRSQGEAGTAALAAAGFGEPLPGLWIAPAATPVPAEARTAIRLEAAVDPAEARRLAAEAWALERAADGYRRFVATFAGLRVVVESGTALGDEEAIIARILMVHAYRRVVLRDPLLPPALLPTDWPGHAARDLCRALYGALLPGSERWLDRHGLNEAGPLPQPGSGLSARFKA